MKYIVQEINPETEQVYISSKPRRDIDDIFRSMGYGFIHVFGSPSVNLGAYRKIRTSFEALQQDDVIIFQLPMMTSPIILRRLFKSLAKRGVKIYVVVHDLDDFEKNGAAISRICDGVFVNNEKCALELIRMKFDMNKVIPLELFDYLIPDSISGACGEYDRKGPVIFAGTLSREESAFLYHLPDNYKFIVYGSGFEGKAGDHVEFGGDYKPEDLPFMLKGSFGLIWDGTSPMTCLGIAGERLKRDNPEQLSLFLASGLPVIVWSESAAADFVIQNECGFTVSSLAEIGYRIKGMSEKTYTKMRQNAENLGIPMRDGVYTRRAVIKMCDE